MPKMPSIINVSQQSRTHPLSNSHWALMAALRFTEADLLANQAGDLTIQQRKMLRTIQWQRNILIGLAIVFEVILIVVLGSGQSLVECSACSDPTFGVMWFVLAAAVFIVFFWLEKQKTYKDLLAGDVLMVEGTARARNPSFMQKGSYLSLYIDQKRFRVKRRVVPAFETDRKYRVYYIPRSNIILSAEEVA